MPQSELRLVFVKCRACDWAGKVLREDLFDHPCPRCGKYLALAAPAEREGGQHDSE